MGIKSEKDTLSGEKLDKNYTELLLNNIHDGVFFVNNECRIFFWNKGAEIITGYDQSQTKNKKCSDHILNPVDEKGKSLCDNDCPLKHALDDGDIHTIDAFFHHMEGYRIPVSIRAFPLMSRNGKIIAAAETFFDISPKFSVPQRKIELEKMQLLDVATEVGNRRFLEIHIQSRLDEIKKYRLPFGLLCVDVDHLEEINETYGKQAGDQVLRVVSQTILNNIRFFDIMGRWDSDEFLVIVLNVNESQLDFVANKLRLLVESSNITVGEKLVRVTISVGATLAYRVDSLGILVDRAESLMKHSKWLGRNRVSLKIEKEEKN
jgi:diguanylate cyclase (GGDEF)-like protein/PAS domain S-box-containing protein